MKKIVLESQGREINITSLEEVETIQDIVTELIIPAFQASGFSKETINDGLSEYLDEYLPDAIAQECMSCQDLKGLNETLNEEYERLAKNYDIILGDYNNLGDRLDNTVRVNEKYAEQIVELEEIEGKLRTQLAETGKITTPVEVEKYVEECTCENCGLFHDPDCEGNIANRAYCIEDGRSHWEPQVELEPEPEPEVEEIYACDHCAKLYPLSELDRNYGLCETCFEKQTCIDCGLLHDYCECNACPECGCDSSNGGGELCTPCQLGRDEGDCIRTKPSFGPEDTCQGCGLLNGECECEIYHPEPKVPVNRVPENNVWTTGNQSTVRDGWVTPPADQTTPEPEQIDLDEEDVKQCPGCGWYVRTRISVCPNRECGYRFLGNISEEDKEKIRASEAEDDGPEQSVGGHCDKCGSFVGGLTINGLCPSCFKTSREEVPKAPQAEAVGVWSTEELKKEGYGVEEKVELCIHCNTGMIESNGASICPDCNYRADCTCQECELKRRKAGVTTLKPEPTNDTVVLTDEEKKENFAKSFEKQETVQEQSNKGEYRPADWTGEALRCNNVHKHFPGINCKDKCFKCPIGMRTIKDAMEHGLFFCPSCTKHHTAPFPDGFCPSCGIHSRSDGGGEFCRRHWDMNREKNGYQADEEENWKDGDEDDPDRYNDDGDY